MLLRVNEVVDIASRVKHETKVPTLRSWVEKLLIDRAKLERQLRDSRTGPAPTTGIVNSPFGRE